MLPVTLGNQYDVLSCVPDTDKSCAVAYFRLGTLMGVDIVKTENDGWPERASYVACAVSDWADGLSDGLWVAVKRALVLQRPAQAQSYSACDAEFMCQCVAISNRVNFNIHRARTRSSWLRALPMTKLSGRIEQSLFAGEQVLWYKEKRTDSQCEAVGLGLFELGRFSSEAKIQ